MSNGDGLIHDAPEGWTTTSLDECGTWSTGGTPSRKTQSYFDGGIRWVKSGDLNDGVVYETEETISENGLQNSAAKILPVGTLSMALYGATIGKLGIIGVDAATNQACANCITFEGLSSAKFLFYYLRSQRESLIAAGQGGAQPNLTNAIVRNWPVILPPLTEQERIVAKVEELLARVGVARERLARVPRILKRFRQAVLAAACDGRLTTDWRQAHTSDPASFTAAENSVLKSKIRRGVPDHVAVPEELAELSIPDTWDLTSTAELLRTSILTDVKDGNHGANHPKRGEFADEGLPFITAAQVQRQGIDYDGAPKVSGRALDRLRVGFAKPDDAILTHKGTVGRTALNTRDCVLTPQTTYYRCNLRRLDPQYLVYFLTSIFFYRQLAAVMSQTTRDFVPIREQYRLFHVLPPLAEQEEIVRRVDALFTLADAVEARVAAATKRAEKLTQAVLAKAFRGELVQTEAELARREGRNYEPASVLLERIRAERAIAKETPKQRKSSSSAAGRVGSSTRQDRAKLRSPRFVTEDEPDFELVPKSHQTPSNGHALRARPAQTKSAGTKSFHPLDDVSTDEFMAAFRSACWGSGPMGEDELLRAVAAQFDYNRVGKEIRARLKNHLRAAIRRQVITRDNGQVYCPTQIFRNYDDETLLKVVKTVTRLGHEYDREEVIVLVTRHLGYAHVSDSIRTRMKSIFNSAIRRNVLGYQGQTIWRET